MFRKSPSDVGGLGGSGWRKVGAAKKKALIIVD